MGEFHGNGLDAGLLIGEQGDQFCRMGCGDSGHHIPQLFAVQHLHIALEEVGVGNVEGTVGAVDLQKRQRSIPGVQAHVYRTNRAAFKFHNAGVCGVHLGVLPGAQNVPGFPADGGKTADFLNGAQEINKGGHVIRTHVTHGAGTLLEEEAGVGMPQLMTRRVKVGGETKGSADGTVVQKLSALLDAGAQEGVGSADAHQALLPGQGHQLFCLGDIQGQRLFAVGVLSGFQNLLVDAVVCSGDGQVHHQLDLIHSQQLLHRAGNRYAITLCGGFCLIHKHICYCYQLQVVIVIPDVGHIDLCNGAAADQTDFNSFHNSPTFYLKFRFR